MLLEFLSRCQKRILKMIAQGESLSDILSTLCLLVEEGLEGSICSVVLLDNEGELIAKSIGPHLPAEYEKDLIGLRIGPNVGTCGTSMFRRETIVVPETLKSPLWSNYIKYVEKYSLLACASVPLFSNSGKILGSFALYYLTPHDYLEWEIDFLKSISSLVSIPIEIDKREERLRLFQAACENADDAIVMTLSNLSPPGPIICYVNPAFTKMTGYSYQEAVGKSPRILQGPKTERAVLDRLKETLLREEHFYGEAINYKKDGTEFYLEWNIAPIHNEEGKVTHYVSIQHDVTERKREEELKNNEIRSKEEKMAEVSHEMKLPLTSLATSTEVMERELLPKVKLDLLQKILKIMKISVDHMIRLVSEILIAARNQASLFSIRPTVIDPADIVKTVTDSFQLILEKRKQLLEVQIVQDCPKILVDPDRIIQVLFNLLSNSIKFTPEGGLIQIRVSIGCLNKVLFEVEDHGIGIPSDFLPHVFERYSRGTFVTPSDVGLGLSISKEIICAHGGEIWAKSKVGKGSTFSFTLPMVL